MLIYWTKTVYDMKLKKNRNWQKLTKGETKKFKMRQLRQQVTKLKDA